MCDDGGVTRRIHLTLAGAACVGLGSCASEHDGWAARHLDGDVWMAAVRAHGDRPEMVWSEVALAVATPVLITIDDHTQGEVTEGRLSHDNVTRPGNYVAGGLTALALGAGGAGWWGGDGGASCEVLLESFLVVEGATEGLKRVVGRQRPDGSSGNSFPSGHTSYSFALATYLARTCDDATGEWYGKLGYLAYGAAGYVAYNRTEGNRHYVSDTTFGAFLGMLLTNLVYDAHFGDGERPSIYRGKRVRVAVEPSFGEEGAGFDVVLRF